MGRCEGGLGLRVTGGRCRERLQRSSLPVPWRGAGERRGRVRRCERRRSWAERMVVDVGVTVDGSEDVEGVHDDGHGGSVSGCSLPYDDVLNVADGEEVKHGEGEEGSCVGEVIATILEVA